MNQTFQTVVQFPSFVNENGVNGTNCVSGAGEGTNGFNLAATGRAGCSGGDIGAPNRSFSTIHLNNGGCVLSTVPLFSDMDDNRHEARK